MCVRAAAASPSLCLVAGGGQQAAFADALLHRWLVRPIDATLADAGLPFFSLSLCCTVESQALSSKAAEGIAPAHNAMLSGDSKSQLPPESGCFKFEADRFTRKQ